MVEDFEYKNELNKKFGTYILINSLDNKVFYVGKGKKNRPSQHISASKNRNKYYIHKKIIKILSQNGTIISEWVFESDVEQECLDKEMEYIKCYGRENLTNLTDGGDGVSGYKMSLKNKEKLKQSKTGKKLIPESIEKREATRKARNIPAWNKGKKMNEEFCKKVAKGGLGRVPWNKGIEIPQYVKDKISATLKQNGRKMSDYNKEQLLKTIKGVPKSPETKRKLSIANGMSVRCIETGQIFNSIKSAARYFEASDTAIHQAIRKNQKCKKYHWEFYNAA